MKITDLERAIKDGVLQRIRRDIDRKDSVLY
jgi:hypothetical protein